MPASFSSTSFIPDNLIAGEFDDLIGEKITVISGQNLVRGAVLGKITASDKYTLSLSTAADGSQIPDFILSENCDASAGDKQAIAYSRGDFIAESLVLGAAHTIASIKEGLRVKNIILINSQS
jgi:RNase P/RNase MRP subunit p29